MSTGNNNLRKSYELLITTINNYKWHQNWIKVSGRRLITGTHSLCAVLKGT